MKWLITYIQWHYSTAYQDITRIWLNYLWFLSHFFSIKLLLETFFQPFRRVKEEKTKGFNLQEMAENISINLMMRLVGMILRSVMLAIGLGIIFLFFAGGLAFHVFWTLFPLVALLIILASLNIINI